MTKRRRYSDEFKLDTLLTLIWELDGFKAQSYVSDPSSVAFAPPATNKPFTNIKAATKRFTRTSAPKDLQYCTDEINCNRSHFQ